jgi:hypothetical protein
MTENELYAGNIQKAATYTVNREIYQKKANVMLSYKADQIIAI